MNSFIFNQLGKYVQKINFVYKKKKNEINRFPKNYLV